MPDETAVQTTRLRSMYDSLTCLPNRSAFYAWLERALERFDSAVGEVTVAFLDLDDFRSLNATYGQRIGDDVLRTVAARLTQAIGADDMVSRLGNDEFGCVFVGLPPEARVHTIAQTLATAISAPMTIGAREFRVSASVGLTSSAAHDCTANVMMKQAAMAMYRAKLNGIGFACFDPAIA